MISTNVVDQSTKLNPLSIILKFSRDMKYGNFLSVNERRAISTQAMHEREEQGVRLGISRLHMMENAGSAVARFIAEKFAKGDSKANVLLLAGTGNNGGDVFVVARHLSYWRDKFEPTLALIGSGEIHAEEALHNWKVLKRINGIRLLVIDSIPKLSSIGKLLTDSQVVVIGIFGTGFKGKPRELQNQLIQLVNSASASAKISVDIPSGMDADTGLFETAVNSHYTITMDSPKLGMIANESAKRICGEILVTNIGLPS